MTAAVDACTLEVGLASREEHLGEDDPSGLITHKLVQRGDIDDLLFKARDVLNNCETELTSLDRILREREMLSKASREELD